MKKRELFQLKKSLENCGNLQGSKFAYGISKNLDRVNSEIKHIENGKNKPSDRFKEYSKKELDLIKSFARTDADGEYIPNASGGYDVPPSKKFDDMLAILQTEYSDAVEEGIKNNADYESLLDEDLQLDIFKIKFEIIPENITARQLSGIFIFIEEQK